MISVGINGFGRIGKNFLRALIEKNINDINVVAINIGPQDINAQAYAFKYDTLMGTYPYDVNIKNNILSISSKNKIHEIFIYTELDPEKIPWKNHNIDFVIEATGKFTKKEGAEKHIKAGAKKVLISAPATNEDVTIIMGVNQNSYDKNKHNIISLGSCTTNALVPTLYVLEKEFGLERVMMNTVRAYTNTQALLDVNATSKDLRRSRAAALNIVPSSTGAMEVLGRIMPQLEGKASGMSLRVPVPTVSFLDVTFIIKKNTDLNSLNNAFSKASQSYLKDILSTTDIPLVSSDFEGNPHSVVIDKTLNDIVGGNLGKIFGWYDNEWGYSNRIIDFLVFAK